ncbi:MAG: MmgE/PrpD family protein [Alphaproteobacteria bacterium]
MAEPTLSEKLVAHHVGLRLEQIPEAVLDSAKLHVLDSLGCLIVGSRLEPGKLAYNLAVATSGSAGSQATATLFGTGARVSYIDAVQAMSAAAHCGEMDDIHGGAGACIGGMIVPALIAMAEKFGGSGRRFLEAVVVGYETTARIGLTINAPTLFARGWWPSSICGAFGVAAAGAKYLDWAADEAANALGIASLNSGGMITGGNEGATARHLIFGRAAQNGIVSLLAAEHGLTGPKRAFEDPRGFCLTLCSEPKWEYLEDTDRYHLLDVAFKPYPCARQLHAGVEALLTLMRQYNVTPDMIEEIELSVPTPNATMVSRPLTPISRAATLGSGQYVMAVTAHRHKMDLESFDEQCLNNWEVHALMRKVKVTGERELDRHFPQYWPGRVTLKLAQGQVYTHEVIIPKGERLNPMTAAEVKEKFLSLAVPVLGEAKGWTVVDQVQSLGDRNSLKELLSALRPSS